MKLLFLGVSGATPSVLNTDDLATRWNERDLADKMVTYYGATYELVLRTPECWIYAPAE